MATENGNKGTNWTPIVAVIAIIAVIAAGFLFVQYRSAQTANADLQAQLDAANEMVAKKEAEMEKTQKGIDAATNVITDAAKQVQVSQAEMEQKIADQQAAIDQANSAVAGLGKVEQCRQLMSVGPKNDDTWYTSDYSENFQQDICKYVRDITRDLDAAKSEGNEDAVEALEDALEIAQPYYDNFSEQCSSVYDMSTCTFITEGQ